MRVSEQPSGDARWAWFLAWLAVGAAYSLCIISATTTRFLVLPIAIAATVFLATRPHSGRVLPGLLSGLSLPLLYVAYLNHSRPGTVGNGLRGGCEQCAHRWNPWPWFGVGVALFLADCAVRVRNRLNRRNPTS